MSASRTIYNPIQKDYVTFLETASETNGKHTLVDVILAPKSGNGLHYHKTFTESFKCLEGELKIQKGKVVYTLLPGDTAVAEPNVLHRFFNTSDQPCKFEVQIAPSKGSFEETLQIAYGLARDGKVSKKGVPKNIKELAVIIEMSETNLPGFLSLIERVLCRVAKTKKSQQIKEELRKKYVMIK